MCVLHPKKGKLEKLAPFVRNNRSLFFFDGRKVFVWFFFFSTFPTADVKQTSDGSLTSALHKFLETLIARACL